LRPISAIVALGLLLPSAPSRAALVPIHFKGSINYVDPGVFYAASSLGVVYGSEVDVTLVVDSSTPDDLAADPTRGQYSNSVRSFSISGGAWSVTYNLAGCCQSSIQVVNQNQPSPEDMWTVDVHGLSVPDPVMGSINELSMSLWGPLANARITSDAIIPPSYPSWNIDGQGFRIFGSGGALLGNVVGVVPEPSVAPLVALLFLIGFGIRCQADRRGQPGK
jgi:hypothetical protein